MKAWWLSVLWIAFFAVGCRPSERQSLDLNELAKYARMSTVVTGVGPVGRPSFRGFLGVGLSPDFEGDWARAPDDKPAEAFGFYAFRKQPVSLTFRAQTRQGVPPKQVNVRVGRRSASFQVTEKLDSQQLELSASEVQDGMNWVQISSAQGVEWSGFQAYPRFSGRSIFSSLPVSPGLSAERDSLVLPFGQSAEFAVPALKNGELNFEVRPIADQGAATIRSEEISLALNYIEEDPVTVRTVHVSGIGKHRIALPDKLGPFVLSLQAQFPGTDPPLPGQVGLEIVSANIEADGTPFVTISSTSKAPSQALDQPETGAEARPNVVLYVVDTLRADSLRNSTLSVPALQAFTKDAVDFVHTSAESPWTKPSVASILTSLRPREHGVIDFTDILGREHLTIAERLQTVGYSTSAIVTNPLVAPPFGFEQGFIDFRLMKESNAASVTNAAVKWLEQRSKTKPFLLYLHTIDPHLPYAPPEPWRRGIPSDARLPRLDRSGYGEFTTRLFHRKISGLDPGVPSSTQTAIKRLYQGEVDFNMEEFGRLIAWLKSQGLYEKSLIILTSDHGEELFERGELGHLHSLYQELVHIPLLIKFPQNSRGGSKVTNLCSQIDILPTILESTGLEPDAAVNGNSLYRKRTQDTSAYAVSEVNAGRQAEEAGQSVVDYLEKGASVTDGRWKFVRMDSSGRPGPVRALFDLSKDPRENHDLLRLLPVTGLRLETELNRILSSQSVSTERPSAPKDTTTDALRSLQYLR